MKTKYLFLSLFMLAVWPAFSQTFELAGSFNNWNPEKMSASAAGYGVYKLTKTLHAGTYEFQVLKDGVWPQSWQGVNRTFTVTKNNTAVTFYARKEGYYHEYGKDWIFFCDAQEFYFCGPAFTGGWNTLRQMNKENKKANTVATLRTAEYMVKVKSAAQGQIIDNDVMIFSNNISEAGNYVVELDFESMQVYHQKLTLESTYHPAMYIGQNPSTTYLCMSNQNRTFELKYGEEFIFGTRLYTRPVSPNVKVTLYYKIDGGAQKSLPLSWKRNFNWTDDSYDSEWFTNTRINMTEGLSPGDHTIDFWFEAFDGMKRVYSRYDNATDFRIKLHIGHIASDHRPEITTIPINKNYILTAIPLDETENADFGNSRLVLDKNARALVNIRYIDGLGRPEQDVEAGITPSGKDLVTVQEYDEFGRESFTWLPGYGTGHGRYTPRSTVISSAKSTALHNDPRPNSYPAYEPSPLNRKSRQHGPGSAWDTGGTGKAVEISYLTNTTSGDAVLKCFKLQIVEGVLKQSYYADKELFVTRTKDEDGNVSYEFTDKLGQLVLFRQMNGTEMHDTYYVYDESGNVRCILSPEGSDKIEASKGTHMQGPVMNLYGHVYEYDSRNRCIAKKMPGTDWVYLIYDKAGRLILTQDGEQRAKTTPEWSFNKYDALGRVILSGIYPTTATRESLTATFANIVVTESRGSGNYGYTWQKQPVVSASHVLTVNYYDDYDHMLSQSGIPGELKWEEKAGYGKRYIHPTCASCSAKGLLTGTRVKLLDSSGEIITAFYYDDKGRVVQTRSYNQVSGMEKEYMAYDFAGNLLKKLHEHRPSAGSNTITETWMYAYDHAGRLLDTWHKIDHEPAVCLSRQQYNELGQLKSNTRHANEKNTIGYTYNVRGWLTGISSANFTQQLSYMENGSNAYKSWSGNIGSISWKTAQEDMRSYSFTYDGLSRMKKADYVHHTPVSSGTRTGIAPDDDGIAYAPPPGMGYEDIDPEDYSEEVVAYDKNGNILHLKRSGLYANTSNGPAGVYIPKIKYGNIDDLTLSYYGNQLENVTEKSSNLFRNVPHSMDFKPSTIKDIPAQYTYDRNGRMTADYNKYIHKIEYNRLHLPEKVATLHGHEIKFVYDATGIKRRVEYTTNLNVPTTPILTTTPVTATNTHTSLTEYYGNKIYRDGNLYMLLTPEGYLTKENGTWQYRYYLRDHLGNIRVVEDAKGTVLETNEYYPFGMPYAQLKTLSVQPYKFAGKEQETMHGVNIQDFEARWKQVALPIFTTPDPLQEVRPWESPYSYCGNNPARWVDSDGRFYGMPPAIAPPPTAPAPVPATTVTTTTPSLPSAKEVVQDVGKFIDKQLEGVKVVATLVGIAVEVAVEKMTNITEKTETSKTETSMEARKEKGSEKKESTNEKSSYEKKSGKNEKHANKKARESAEDKYKETKEKYETLDKKSNKTPEEKKELKKLEKQKKHWENKKNYTGDHDHQKGRGGN